MLAALITALLLHFGGGDGSFSFEKTLVPYLQGTVTDASRYAKVVELIKDADENKKRFTSELTDVRAKELKALIVDYDTTDEQFHQFYAKSVQSRIAAQQKMIDLRFKMTTVMTEDEWDALYRKIDAKAAIDRK